TRPTRTHPTATPRTCSRIHRPTRSGARSPTRDSGSTTTSRCSSAEEGARVDGLPLHEELVVEVRSRAPTRAPDAPDDLPLLDPLPRLHVDRRQVAVEGRHAVAVIERDVLAEAPVDAGGRDHPGGGRRDRRPRG